MVSFSAALSYSFRLVVKPILSLHQQVRIVSFPHLRACCEVRHLINDHELLSASVVWWENIHTCLRGTSPVPCLCGYKCHCGDRLPVNPGKGFLDQWVLDSQVLTLQDLCAIYRPTSTTRTIITLHSSWSGCHCACPAARCLLKSEHGFNLAGTRWLKSTAFPSLPSSICLRGAEKHLCLPEATGLASPHQCLTVATLLWN